MAIGFKPEKSVKGDISKHWPTRVGSGAGQGSQCLLAKRNLYRHAEQVVDNRTVFVGV